jgi:hypothetical protein
MHCINNISENRSSFMTTRDDPVKPLIIECHAPVELRGFETACIMVNGERVKFKTVAFRSENLMLVEKERDRTKELLRRLSDPRPRPTVLWRKEPKIEKDGAYWYCRCRLAVYPDPGDGFWRYLHVKKEGDSVMILDNQSAPHREIKPRHGVSDGKARHPDEFLSYLETIHFGRVSDRVYLRHLQDYADWRGVDQVKLEPCSRTHLLDQLKE